MSAEFTVERRRFLTGATAIAAAGALSACVGRQITTRGAGSAGTAGQGVALLPAADGAPATGAVSFAHWRAEDSAVSDRLIARFVQANPQASVTQDISPSNDYQSTALQRIRGGSIGNAFTAFRGTQFTNIAKAGLFAGLGAQPFVDDYVASRRGRIRAGRSSGCRISSSSTCRSSTRTPSTAPGWANRRRTGTDSSRCASACAAPA